MRLRAITSRLLFVVLVALAALVAPRTALADDPPKPQELSRRQATFTWEAQEKGPDILLASYSYVDILDGIRSKLESGLPTVIVMRAFSEPRLLVVKN